MLIKKRDGTPVEFERHKIVEAIEKANREVDANARINSYLIEAISLDIEQEYQTFPEIGSVEDIQDMVEKSLIRYGAALVAVTYIKYRYRRELVRQSNTTDESIKELLDGNNEYWNRENSNKNSSP